MVCYPDRTRDDVKYYLDDNELVLRCPELGDTEQIVKNRLLENARGLRLRDYRRSIWPAYRQLKYEFLGLKEEDQANILGFVKDTQGLEINLLDYNDRIWTGVISNPGLKVSHLNEFNYATTIEFEGSVDITKPDFEGLTIVSRNPVWGNSTGNVLETVIKYATSGERYTYNKSSNRKLYDYKFKVTYAKAREFVDFFWFYDGQEVYFEGRKGIIRTIPSISYDKFVEFDMVIEEIE